MCIVAMDERRLSVVDQMEATVETNLKRAESLRQSIVQWAAGRISGWPMTKKKRASTKRRQPVQGTIELCRSTEGHMYFSAPIGDEHRRWRVYPKGEKWLANHGYTVGMKITGSTANYMRKLDLVYTLRPRAAKKGERKNPLAELARDTEIWEKNWTEDNDRYPALIKGMQSRKTGSQQ